MGVDQFTNNEKFCLSEFCINSSLWKSYVGFFHLPVKGVDYCKVMRFLLCDCGQVLCLSESQSLHL